MKHPKPNTPEQIERINTEIRKKSRRWIYYTNPIDVGWRRERACDEVCEISSNTTFRYQLIPPRNVNKFCKESLYGI